MRDLAIRFKLYLLARLLKWLHGYFTVNSEEWTSIDTVRGLVYKYRRDRWRRT